MPLHDPAPLPADTPLPATEEPLSGSAERRLRVLDPGKVRGVLLHFHAGGLTMGAPAMADASNSLLARTCGIATASLDYRLAPQHPHPRAVDDGEAAALWLLRHAPARFGTDRLLIGGDSAGAWLAAQTLLRLRERHGVADRFRAAYFAVGCFDMSMTPSQRASTAAMFLSPARLKGTRTAAFPGLDGELLRDPSISPLYAPLGGLPPAIFSVGTDDAVLDDSLFMAARWQAAGNVAELQVYPEATHLFMSLPTPMAAEAWRRVAAFFDRHLV